MKCQFPGCSRVTTRTYCKVHRVWVEYLKRPVSALIVAVALLAPLGCTAKYRRHLEQSKLVSESIFPLTRDYLRGDVAYTSSERQVYLDAMRVFEEHTDLLLEDGDE